MQDYNTYLDKIIYDNLGKNNIDPILEELHYKCIDKFRKVASRDISKVTDFNEYIWKSYFSNKYDVYTYFNFDNPLVVSIWINPDGIFYKLLPIRSKENSIEIYGLTLENLQELYDKRIALPIIDTDLRLFSFTKDELVFNLVEKSVKKSLCINYLTIEMARAMLGEKELYKTLELYFKKLQNYAKNINNNINWGKTLGTNANVAELELSYNAMTTSLQFKLQSLKIKNETDKLLKNNIYNIFIDLESKYFLNHPVKPSLYEFLYLYSTFSTDPIFYSPQNEVLADKDDILESINIVSQFNYNLSSIPTLLYKGLVLEVGTSILKKKMNLEIINDIDNIIEIHKNRCFIKIKNNIRDIIKEKLVNNDYSNIKEIMDYSNQLMDEIKECNQSDKTRYKNKIEIYYIILGTLILIPPTLFGISNQNMRDLYIISQLIQAITTIPNISRNIRSFISFITKKISPNDLKESLLKASTSVIIGVGGQNAFNIKRK